MKRLKIILLSLALASLLTVGMVMAATTWTTNLTGTWTTTTSFSVYTDSGLTLPLGATNDLGDFSPSANTGTETFYIKNDGNVAVTVYPHLATPQNMAVTQWTPLASTGLTLQPQAVGTYTMAFSVSGVPSAALTFNTTP